MTLKRFFILVTVIVLSGCGVETTDPSSGSALQRFIGSFRALDTTPLEGLTVTLLNTGRQITTDQDGLGEIRTPTVEESITVEISGDWGSAQLTLSNIPPESGLIEYDVSVDQGNQTIRLTSIIADGSILFEEDLQTPDSEDSGNQENNNEDDQDQPKNPGKDKDRKYKTGVCVSCHVFRGAPRCRSSFWKSIHKNTYSCRTNSFKNAVDQDIADLIDFLHE